MRKTLLLLSILSLALFSCQDASVDDITLENAKFRLVIASDATAKSLVIKETGEEMLEKGTHEPLFTVTQERPYNNEVKLENPNTRTIYKANRVRREGNRLIVGFETASYEASIKIQEGSGYITFTLEEFLSDRDRDYPDLKMDVPPVVEMRLLQLPVKQREHFGDWLNCMWDDRSALCVASCDPYAEIWHSDRQNYRLLTADLLGNIRLEGGKAAIVVGCGKEDFLNTMDGFEKDLDLPRGVQSRRSPKLNRSIYWTSDAGPENIDEHIALARQAGLEMMLFYYTCFVEEGGWDHLGDYKISSKYPGGYQDIKAMLDKVKAAGITPGFHTLQTHIGLKSAYVTPVLDHRLGKKQLFTLKETLPGSGEISTIIVEENPQRAPLTDGCRVLAFGGEAFTYEGYTTERPYRFTGVKRCHFETLPEEHKKGEIGGVLDISEFGATSVYLDQKSDLQDEVADKIAAIYNCGFEFFYMDGSEGVLPPAGINVALSQYRVFQKLEQKPIFTEGAAKSHFGWHMQAGANAFDVFPPSIFEEMILKYPYAEAPRMQENMTRVDFGWWSIDPETTPEMWDFAEEKAVEYSCPVTIQMSFNSLRKNPRADELLAVIKKWEDYRRSHP